MHALFDLNGRVAAVTGGSSGLGRAMAGALASAGARVVLIARREAELRQAALEIDASGGQARWISADLADRADVDRVCSAVLEPFGDVDILINAAGINLRKPVDEVSPSDWDLHLQLHLTTPFFLSRAVAQPMIRRGWGRIINIASLQSVRAFPNSAPYGAGKGGIVQLTRALAEAWSRHGINVNAIAPGFFPTELTAPVFNDPERAAANARQTMIGRNGRLEDLVGPTLFLASPASDYVTGQTLFVDGGFSAK